MHDRPFTIDQSKAGRALGVHFKPGGGFALFGAAMPSLRNEHVALADLIGTGEAQRLHDLSLSAREDDSLVRTVTQFLLDRLQEHHHAVVDGAMSAIDAARVVPDIQCLVADSGYSHRHFSERFRAGVGMSAKRYARVVRFQRALKMLERPGRYAWNDLVSACGYYDQAHLIHEFQSHAGMAPTTYVAHRAERLNHPRLPASLAPAGS
jgi:AraC-like DNA-binding protein